ncbi:MAG: hypothetical protein HY911_16240 [Desulfobacterales bacterium]|nr:hypothetical protein [Desulfobacterales bacterium]
MEPNKIVVKFKNKSVVKGTTIDFFPNKPKFHLTGEDGKTTEISIENLKAIFFVKDLQGDKDHKYDYKDEIAAAGKKMRVHFTDGEVISGYTLGYSPDRDGFFLTPADLKGNNARIFVVRSATKKVEFIQSL